MKDHASTTGTLSSNSSTSVDHRRWSTVVPNTSRSNRGAIRRCHNPTVSPSLGFHGCRTLYEGLRRGLAINPLGPCLGYRAVSTSGMATPYIYSTYTEVVARVDCVAAGLNSLSLVPPNNPVDKLKLIGLYLPNCMEWVIAEHAVYSLGGATIPFYDTLGPDTVQFVLTQTETKTLVCSRRQLTKVCEVKRSGLCPVFDTAILVDGVTPQASAMAHEVGLQIMSFAQVEAVGAERIATYGAQEHHPPSLDDIATFSYTSGTTGTPKGALLTHGNLMSAIAGVDQVGGLTTDLTDRHLSYLPLAHIFERIVMAQVLSSGASVAFFRGDPLLLIEDLQACRPTILPVAPRVLNKIYDKIQNAINATGGLKKTMFDSAIAAKTEGLKRGHLKHGLYDRLIFNKLKKGLGMDYIRLIVSGSAPLSENVMLFFRCLLGVPVAEGYGQTEGSAAATISCAQDVSTFGHVGGPTGVVEIALYDVPEMGYLHTDESHRGLPCEGRGEVCIRGPNVFKGYYKDDEKSKETIDEEGWLHSGDVGLWRPDGALQIIDRKKNIFKLAQGEYVAPEKIENILTRSAFIAQCFVYGDSLQSTLVAIVVPDEDVLRDWAKSNVPALAAASFAAICQDPEVNLAVLSDMKALSVQSKLQGFETVRGIHLEPVPLSVENDLMTPTFKLKRQKVRDAYEHEIATLYATAAPSRRSKL